MAALESRVRRRPTPWRTIPVRLQAIAAVSALVVTGAIVAATGSPKPSRAANHFAERAVNAGVYLLERKDRLVEDLRILRVVIATAFEGRLDRMSDRVDDYRRFLEKRRSAEKGQKKKTEGLIGSAVVRASIPSSPKNGMNPAAVTFVKVCASDGPPWARGRGVEG
jgi:hypothetical protein